MQHTGYGGAPCSSSFLLLTAWEGKTTAVRTALGLTASEDPSLLCQGVRPTSLARHALPVRGAL